MLWIPLLESVLVPWFVLSRFIVCLVSWFLVLFFWFVGFLVSKIIGVLVSKFLGFLVSKNLRLLASKFLGFKDSMIYITNLIDIGLISKIFKMLFDGSAGFFGARLFQNRQTFGFPKK